MSITRKLMGVTKGPAPAAFYTTDFGDDALNALPSEWSYISSNGSSYQRVVADASTISGKKLEANYSQFLYLSTAPTDPDVDIFAIIRYNYSGSSSPTGPFGRKVGGFSGISEALNNTYFAGKTTTAATIEIEYRNNSGGITPIDSAATTLINSDWLKVRLRLNGTQQLAKVWHINDPEPVSWQLSGTNTALTSAGDVGLRSSLSNSGAILECQYFSVGVGGNPPDIV